MVEPIHDVRIKSMQRLPTPRELEKQFPMKPSLARDVAKSRREITEILFGEDIRLLVIVGPCSIHDTKAGLEYAQKLAHLAAELRERILVVMRVYFEKPRTTIGWKGLIYDPHLTGEFNLTEGLKTARQFLLQVAGLHLPIGTEFLDPFTPQYIGDLVSWAAIGARTAESQIHRQMASGLSMPVGFKNSTSGDVQVAIDALVAARAPQGFFGIDEEGKACAISTSGNANCHLILRGGRTGTNYDPSSIQDATRRLEKANGSAKIIVDCSHDNSKKNHKTQPHVFYEVLRQKISGNKKIAGMMLESNLSEGNQKLGDDPSKLQYGVSITDECLSWQETAELLLHAFEDLRI